MIFEEPIYKAGLYLRLSRDDELQGESISISTQRTILKQYCNEKGFIVIDEYCDDGYSGTNFDRPAFQRMIDDIYAKKINLVVTKDLSRFGRNYIEQGFYIENVFQKNNVRYIAVHDNVDTLKGDEDFMLPIRNVINSMFSKETSRKIRSAANAKAREGQHIPSRPPYGYKISPEDKHKLIIDEEAAEVVRKIFKMASEGSGAFQIAKKLSVSGIVTPMVYFVQKNPDYYENPIDNNKLWWTSTVQSILSDIVYIGSIVWGRTRTVAVGSNKIMFRPEEEWVVAENAHEPIITKELWDLVQEKLRSRKRAVKEYGKPHIFAGIIRCMDCGKVMRFNNRKTVSKNIGEFNCRTNAEFGREYCTTHYITYDNVSKTVISSIRGLAAKAIKNENAFLKQLESESETYKANADKELAADIAKTEERYNKVCRISKQLYEDNTLGKVTQNFFITAMPEYEKEQKELFDKLEALKKVRTEREKKISQLSAFVGVLKKYADVKELDSVMLNELISKVEIGQRDINPDNGRREQEIRITYRLYPVVQSKIIIPR